MLGPECELPTPVRTEDEFGINWDGEYDALNRLIVGLGTNFREAAIAVGLSEEKVPEVTNNLIDHLYENLAVPAMPIQDAIDLARFLVETTAGFVRFAVSKQPKTVGGPVEIATITKHEGFRWIQRKHFYRAELNSPGHVA